MSVIVFVGAMISLFVAACYYLREVNVALSSVRDEARDARFMDIAVTTEIRRSHHV
jgi:urease beta subunit